MFYGGRGAYNTTLRLRKYPHTLSILHNYHTMNKRERKNAEKKLRIEKYSRDFKARVERGGPLIDIPYPPKHQSEFEVQSALFQQLKLLGYNVRGEVSYQKDARTYARFDLVVYQRGVRPIIIEVKRERKIRNAGAIKQLKKYAVFNADILFCFGAQQVAETVSKVKELTVVNSYHKGLQ